MKLHIVDRERHYELTYLVSPSLTSDELSKVREKVASTITKYKGEVVEVIDWGRKTLEYPIKHEGKNYNEAVYTHSVVMLPSTAVAGFDRDMRLNTSIIRHLLVIAEEIKQKASKPVAVAQSAASENMVEIEKTTETAKKASVKSKTTRGKKITEEQTAS